MADRRTGRERARPADSSRSTCWMIGPIQHLLCETCDSERASHRQLWLTKSAQPAKLSCINGNQQSERRRPSCSSVFSRWSFRHGRDDPTGTRFCLRPTRRAKAIRDRDQSWSMFFFKTSTSLAIRTARCRFVSSLAIERSRGMTPHTSKMNRARSASLTGCWMMSRERFPERRAVVAERHRPQAELRHERTGAAEFLLAHDDAFCSMTHSGTLAR